MLIVQKYGGSSVANLELMENIAKRIIKTKESGASLVVVLSAQGKTTDNLTEIANQVNPEGDKRERDMLLSTGEQHSIALMALILQRLGYPAISLTGWQAGIATSADHQSARIQDIDTGRLEKELSKGNIVIVAGFQGITCYGDITTLGRGGSDTTAVALAAALKADACQIYTDVDGVYSADPRIVPDAVKLSEISYSEMMELASMGAKVLEKRSVGLAKKYQVPLWVKHSHKELAGTLIKEGDEMEGISISGVVANTNIARISVSGIQDMPGVWFKIFNAMNDANIAIDFVYQTKHGNGTKDISFIVESDRMADAKKAISDNAHKLSYTQITSDTDTAKVSVVSKGASANPGIPSLMFEVLFDAGINIDSVSTSEIRVSVLINKDHANHAAGIIHKKFLDEGYIKE
ncbi:MAG: aspartate kinase [Defluviitaleaceae bacterium]|nr:aspartate kinase [Defluviitaleaceae bacterium]